MKDLRLLHKIATQAVYEHYSLQKVHELTFFLSLLDKNDLVVEIGCDAGGTSWAIEEIGVRRQIGIDLAGQEFASGLAWQSNSDMLEMIWGDSHDKRTKDTLVDRLAGETIDILLIDGDHTYTGVADDFRMYGKLCSGLVIFHDIVKHETVPTCKVDQFYKEIKHRYPHVEYVAEYDESWGGIGVLDLSFSKRLENAMLEIQG